MRTIYFEKSIPKILHDSLRWTRAGGTVVLTGVSLKPMHVDLTPVWYQEVNLIGLYAHGMEVLDQVRRSTFDLTSDLLLTKKLSVEGLITHRFPLENWQTAVRAAKDKSTGAVKVVLDFRGASEPKVKPATSIK